MQCVGCVDVGCCVQCVVGVQVSFDVVDEDVDVWCCGVVIDDEGDVVLVVVGNQVCYGLGVLQVGCVMGVVVE